TTNKNGLGRHRILAGATANVWGSASDFLTGGPPFEQRIPLSEPFPILGRLFPSLPPERTAPAYRFARSFPSPRTSLGRGPPRPRGSIPPALMRRGAVQVAGGANLRGYLHQDIVQLNNGETPLHASLSSFNLEVNYPNPIGHALNSIPIVGNFIDLRSYL